MSGNPKGSRVLAAGMRAMNAHASVERAAKKVTSELEEITAVTTGVPVSELDKEDSLVVVVAEVIAQHKHAG